jgi:hypothetical protein
VIQELLMDREELGVALAYLSGALPCKTRGVTLATVDGKLIGQFLDRHDGHQVAAMLADAHGFSRRLGRQLGNRTFRYQLDVCEEGAVLTLMIQDSYLVLIDVTNLKSVDLLLRAVHEGLPPLLEVLGLPQA